MRIDQRRRSGLGSRAKFVPNLWRIGRPSKWNGPALGQKAGPNPRMPTGAAKPLWRGDDTATGAGASTDAPSALGPLKLLDCGGSLKPWLGSERAHRAL